MNSYPKLQTLLWLMFFSCWFCWHATGQGINLDTDPALKLHLDFDEDFSSGRVIDVSGNGNDGWQFDPTNWIAPATGVFGSTAAQFTFDALIYTDPPRVHQVSTYIAVTNVNGFYQVTNTTISFWAKFDTNNDGNIFILSAGYPQMYAQDTYASSNSWSLNRNSSSFLTFMTYPEGIYHTQVASWPDDTIQPGGFNQILATTNFHLYSITSDCATNQVITYYDGQPYMTNTIDLPWLRVYGCYHFPWLCIGALGHDGTPDWGDDSYPNAGFFVGKLDDLRIYNRTLSATEVQSLYQRYAPNVAVKNASPGSVQLSWKVNTNALYQVEYASSLTTNDWAAMGSALPGGSTNSIVDPTAGNLQRFYRVRLLPDPAQ